MPLESDSGPTTLPEYLATALTHTDGSRVVYYLTERGSANQYFLLANARGMRVFNCDEPFAEQFLERYAEVWPERVHLSRLDVAGSEIIFEPLSDEELERFAELQAAYNPISHDLRFVTRVSRFRPAEMPAVLTETRDSKSRREMEETAGNLAIPGFIRELVKGFLIEEHHPLVLHLNADNPAIQRLAARSSLRDQVSRLALMSLFYNAAMLLYLKPGAEDVRAVFAHYNQVIELMLSLAAERADFGRRLNRRAELDELRAVAGGGAAELDPTSRASSPCRSRILAPRSSTRRCARYWRTTRTSGGWCAPTTTSSGQACGTTSRRSWSARTATSPSSPRTSTPT